VPTRPIFYRELASNIGTQAPASSPGEHADDARGVAEDAAMVQTAPDQLRTERDGFRDLVVRLSTIVLRNLVEQKRLPKLYSGEASPPLPESMSLTEIALRLREAAIRCAHLSRERADSPIGQEFESLSVELADVAQRLEALAT
jgi:hypothetical protein